MSDTQEDLDFIEELRGDFLSEVTFLLEQCEESYLKLENPELREEELGKIFRLAHSLKGTGAAVGFLDLAAFAHQVEDCLTQLRNRPELVAPDVVTLLLRCGDAFRERIEQLKRKDSAPWSVEALEAEVRRMLARFAEGAPVAEAHPVAEVIELTEQARRDASVENDEDWAELAANARASVEAVPALEPIAEADLVRLTEPVASSAPMSSAPAVQPPAAVGATGARREVLKIDAERVESVLNLVGELVVLKSQLINKCQGADSGLSQVVGLVDKTIRELQDKTLSMRVTPLKSLFLKTQRVVRDLAIKLGKPVEFVMEGEDTEIDRAMVDALADPLMHLVRNSLDHGIEPAEQRRTSGKPEKGMIYLRALQRGGRILIELSDDGRGLQREKILKKALENGIISPASAETLSTREVQALIFAAGFSTADKVTDVSGRGVGMDVVKTQIEKLKGGVEIESVPGTGTLIRMSLPMTTAILDGMQVRLGSEPYILPMESIRELVDLESRQLFEVVRGRPALRHRGRLFPVIDMQDGFSSGRNGQPKLVALVDAAGREVALLLSGVEGQSQVVLKNLDDRIRACRGVSGAAILGDGKVALVLDPAGLAQGAVAA